MINKGGFGVDGAPFFCGKFLNTAVILVEASGTLVEGDFGIRGLKSTLTKFMNGSIFGWL
jgi:hypothetical protein